MRTLALLLAACELLVAGQRHRILFNRIGAAETGLFVADADGRNERPLLPSTGLDYNASFSPDGRWIVFTSERNGSSDLYRVRSDGSGIERLTDDPAYDDQAAFSPDGKTLAFVSTRGGGTAGIWLLDVATRKARSLTSGAGGNFRPSWSPDGKWVAFSSDRDTPLRRAKGRWEQLHLINIYIIRPDGTGLRRLTATGNCAGGPKWSRDSRRVVFYEISAEDTWNARAGGALPVSQQELGETGASQIVSIDIESGARVEHTQGPGVKVSPQYLAGGLIGFLVKSGGDQGIRYTDGGKGPANVRNPAWSPEGKQVVYHRILSPRRNRMTPAFSPDPEFELVLSEVFPAFDRAGGRLVVSSRGESRDIADAGLEMMNPDGSGRRWVYHEKGKAVMSPEWSPQGDWIAFGLGTFFLGPSHPAQVAMVHPDGAGFRLLTSPPNNNGFPSWSPDGKRIVYRTSSENERGLRILNLEDGKSSVLTTEYDNFPVWSPRG
ncbi:MAG TPA: hypothetical protein VEU62_21895, partial [Bryobacterales bacterium]|nr:hypothetical protein [Bryobacterales bacterium]